jgi:hypothetical protein
VCAVGRNTYIGCKVEVLKVENNSEKKVVKANAPNTNLRLNAIS